MYIGYVYILFAGNLSSFGIRYLGTNLTNQVNWRPNGFLLVCCCYNRLVTCVHQDKRTSQTPLRYSVPKTLCWYTPLRHRQLPKLCEGVVKTSIKSTAENYPFHYGQSRSALQAKLWLKDWIPSVTLTDFLSPTFLAVLHLTLIYKIFYASCVKGIEEYDEMKEQKRIRKNVLDQMCSKIQIWIPQMCLIAFPVVFNWFDKFY